MESIKVKERFIELRAKGWSFDKISKELGKAKQTLIDWSKELQEEIANLKALELEALYEQYYLMKEARIKTFGKILNKIQEEIDKRDLSQVETDKLLELQLKYNAQIREELIEPAFKSSQEIQEDKQGRELLEEFTAPQIPEQKRLRVG